MEHRLNIDIETYSSTDISAGVYKYVEAKDFEILIIAYSVDGGEVQALDLKSDYDKSQYNELVAMLTSDNFLKIAFNASFERTCLARYFKRAMPPSQWKCTMVDSVRLGLPAKLETVAEVLKVDSQKDKIGTSLIRYFSVPCKPTKVNGGRTRNLPEHDMDKWGMFIDYCKQDVRAESAVRKIIDNFDYPALEQSHWILDQEINDRGVMLDRSLMEGAVDCDIQTREMLISKAKELTGLDNPNSPSQLLEWFKRHDCDIPNMQKASVDSYAKEFKGSLVGDVLAIRQELSKSSVKKYQKMQEMVCSDDRVHGILQFYGAAKTGRWAGRGVQVQNLTKHYISDEDLAFARDLIRDKQFDVLDLYFKESRQNLLSQLIRTVFIAKPEHKFVVYDFSAIEARVIAWFANEQWRQEVFATHGKIYEASASQMFKVPIEEIGKGSPLRQKGKVAELALGYQGGEGALISMGALNMGIPQEELKGIIDSWRASNPGITQFWNNCQNAVIEVIRNHNVVTTNYCKFYIKKGCLRIELPSGRCLSYLKPHLTEDEYGRTRIKHLGMNTANKWDVIDTYGGKLVENIVQATARDCLAEALLRLDMAGYKCVMHIHDEVVLEVPKSDVDAMDKVKEIMNAPLLWADGLILNSAGFESEFYMKD